MNNSTLNEQCHLYIYDKINNKNCELCIMNYYVIKIIKIILAIIIIKMIM